MTGTAIKTNGEGQPYVDYLNLAVTLADAWAADVAAEAEKKREDQKVRGELWLVYRDSQPRPYAGRNSRWNRHYE